MASFCIHLIRVFRLLCPQLWRHPMKGTDEGSSFICPIVEDICDSEITKLKSTFFVNENIGS